MPSFRPREIARSVALVGQPHLTPTGFNADGHVHNVGEQITMGGPFRRRVLIRGLAHCVTAQSLSRTNLHRYGSSILSYEPCMPSAASSVELLNWGSAEYS